MFHLVPPSLHLNRTIIYHCVTFLLVRFDHRSKKSNIESDGSNDSEQNGANRKTLKKVEIEEEVAACNDNNNIVHPLMLEPCTIGTFEHGRKALPKWKTYDRHRDMLTPTCLHATNPCGNWQRERQTNWVLSLIGFYPAYCSINPCIRFLLFYFEISIVDDDEQQQQQIANYIWMAEKKEQRNIVHLLRGQFAEYCLSDTKTTFVQIMNELAFNEIKWIL